MPSSKDRTEERQDAAHVVIIGEAGVNHNGNIDLARKLIDIGAEAGVDYVKFQTWKTDELVSVDAPMAKYQMVGDDSASQYEMLKKLEISYSDFHKLKEHCRGTDVKFLSTPDDVMSLNFLVDELHLDLLKVGSGEVANLPFLRKVGQKKTKVILSTGMATLGEVERAYHTLLDSGAKKVSILHCTSNYPAPYESVNLKAIPLLRHAFSAAVGYSDHTLGTEVSVAAVALGAEIIEKHYTSDRNLPGPDHQASLTPEDLKLLVRQVRNIEQALAGTGMKRPHPSELDTRRVVFKGLYAAVDIKCGEVIKLDSLTAKRPATGIAAEHCDLIIGKAAKHDIERGRPVSFGDVDFD